MVIKKSDERELRQQLREENRALKQELAEQRYALQKLQTEVKILTASMQVINEKTTHLLRSEAMRVADMQLMMYTMADKYMPDNSDFLIKPAH